MATFDEELLDAISKRDSLGVRDALRNGADVNSKRPGTQQTPLHIAAIAGHRDVIETLLTEGADATAKDTHKKTPSYYASLNNHDGIAQLLNEAAQAQQAQKLDTQSGRDQLLEQWNRSEFSNGLSGEPPSREF